MVHLCRALPRRELVGLEAALGESVSAWRETAGCYCTPAAGAPTDTVRSGCTMLIKQHEVKSGKEEMMPSGGVVTRRGMKLLVGHSPLLTANLLKICKMKIMVTVITQ